MSLVKYVKIYAIKWMKLQDIGSFDLVNSLPTYIVSLIALYICSYFTIKHNLVYWYSFFAYKIFFWCFIHSNPFIRCIRYREWKRFLFPLFLSFYVVSTYFYASPQIHDTRYTNTYIRIPYKTHTIYILSKYHFTIAPQLNISNTKQTSNSSINST